MTIWQQPFRSARTVLAVAVVLGGMTIAATPAAASTTSRGITCGPKTVTAHPAPGIGASEVFTVGSAGTVTLRQLSNTTLQVTDTDPTHGWKYHVFSRSGSRPHVGFQGVGTPDKQERFWARMNTLGTPGTVINIVIQSCT
jgi:hypothetical protein